MNVLNYCQDCEIEFKVHHDADHAYFPITHCPFCGVELEAQEQYSYDEDDE